MAKRSRTDNFEIEFSGPGETIRGWAFPVSSAFREPLDIQFTQRKGGARWTQGEPPQYQFSAGARFFDPPAARQMVWSDALRVMQRVIKIESATPDVLDGSNVRSGFVAFRIDYYQDGKITSTERNEATQRGFVSLLRDGVIPDQELVKETRLPKRHGMTPRWTLTMSGSNDEQYERTVRARSLVERQDVLYIDGVCEYARAPRQFRVNDIIQIFDLDTGEIVEDPRNWIAVLKQTAIDAMPGALKEEAKRGLRVLMAIAAAGGGLNDERRALLKRYTLSRASMIGVTVDDNVSAVIEALLGRMRPSREVALAALEKQSRLDREKWPDHHGLILEVASALALACDPCNEVNLILQDISSALHAADAHS